MTSHDGSWGVLGNWSAPFSFFPKGALTHHLPAGQAVVLPHCVRRALCAADCALFGERQTMPPCLRAAVAIVCAEWISAPIHSACENLHPAALSQRQGESKMIALVSLLGKRNRKSKYGGDSNWQYTTWKRKSSAEARADPHAQHRPI